MITVVKVNRDQSNFTRYCGREWAGLPRSRYHNPYHGGKVGGRENAILKFIFYFWNPDAPSLRHQAATEIDENEILGCWCHPLDCHCDIIAGYVNWKRRSRGLFDE